jgi:hypothetical protein
LPGRAAAEWPDKPVRVIVPYAAGGANDSARPGVRRTAQQGIRPAVLRREPHRRRRLIGTEAVARAAPDGTR